MRARVRVSMLLRACVYALACICGTAVAWLGCGSALRLPCGSARLRLGCDLARLWFGCGSAW